MAIKKNMCPACGGECNASGKAIDKLMPDYVPFRCSKCNRLKFPIRAIRDMVFMCPIPAPPKLTKKSLIYLPEKQQDEYRPDVGVVLSVGNGWWGQDAPTMKWENVKHGLPVTQKQSGAIKFHPTPSEIRAGIKVKYVRSPFEMAVCDDSGKAHKILYMTTGDIQGIICDDSE